MLLGIYILLKENCASYSIILKNVLLLSRFTEQKSILNTIAQDDEKKKSPNFNNKLSI